MRIEPKTMYRVFYTEYERGYGQRKFKEPVYFTTEKEAIDEVNRFNAPNLEETNTPDWYVIARYLEVN